MKTLLITIITMAKNKIAKKKAKKKVVKKAKRAAPARSTEVVIRVQPQPSLPALPTVSDLSQPMKNGKNLTIQKTWVSEGQLIQILQKTPPQYVYKRPGKGGGTFDYVTVAYVTKALNYIFGWNWDFEVVQQGMEGGQVWVLGKLTVRGIRDGQTIVKTQYGRADIKYKKGTKEMLDYGNDLKGASSDALKKCASMIGIASDVYGKADYKHETDREVIDNTPTVAPGEPTPAGARQGPDGDPVFTCEVCDGIITPQEANYSQKMFKKNLCRQHQKK